MACQCSAAVSRARCVEERRDAPQRLDADHASTITITLAPFEVLTLELTP